MKRIAYLTPLYFSDESVVGGGERYPLYLAKGVVEASEGEYTVELVSFGPKTFTKELSPGVKLRVLQLAYTPLNPLDPVSWGLSDAIADAELVHIHQAYTRHSELSIILAKVFGKPICVTDHGGATSRTGVEFRSLDLVDRVVCQSAFAARMLRTSAPISLVMGGVDTELFQPATQEQPRDRILFVGRLLPHKGIDQLIQALPPELPLTCCGRPYNNEFFAVLKKLAEGKQVEFRTDATDEEIREYYRRAWAGVLPSVYRDYYGNTHVQPELMGFVLLEAMACGTPAICNNVGGMPEFVHHGETGFVYDTLEELTGYLRKLANSPSLVKQMGQAARKSAVEEFSLRVCGEKLIEIYDSLIGERAACRRAS